MWWYWIGLGYTCAQTRQTQTTGYRHCRSQSANDSHHRLVPFDLTPRPASPRPADTTTVVAIRVIPFIVLPVMFGPGGPVTG